MAAIQGNLPRPADLPREEARMPPLSRTNATSAPQCSGNSSSDKIPDSIDSALLAALRDPRERLGLLKLEKVMVDFHNSPNDPYVDIGGPYNSVVVSPSTGSNAPPPQRPHTTFQRCILHRLADRFRMTRETNNPYIRLWKQSDSCLPPRLLVDLDPSEYEEPDQMPLTTNGSVSSGILMMNNPPKNMKMKIMKRSSSSGLSSASDAAKANRKKNSAATNLSDKEKAYAEARARIFSDGDGENDVESTPVVPAAAIVNQYLPMAASSSSLPSSEEDALNNNYISVSGTSNTNNNGNGNGNGNGRPSKATWRNRRQEENDPDFQRGVVLQPTYNEYYASAAVPAWGSQQDSTTYYNGNTAGNAYQGRGGGRGRGGGGGGRYQQNNYYGNNNSNNYGYRRSHSGEAPANVNSLEEFPSLR
jgi:hypothetical protein